MTLPKIANHCPIFMGHETFKFRMVKLFYLEETGGFEPPALQFCKLLPWATRARLQNDVQ